MLQTFRGKYFPFLTVHTRENFVFFVFFIHINYCMALISVFRNVVQSVTRGSWARVNNAQYVTSDRSC